jgi:transposase
MRHYITDWKRRRKFYYDNSQGKSVKTVTVERKDIFKLLYHPIEKVKAVSQEFFERICSENPCFRKIHNIIWEFKKILIDKDVNGLKKWADKTQDLQIPEINSFVNGLNRDFDAVRNSIKYEYNNGLAEGSVNKLKVIKRIMYGRCNFENLRIRTLQLGKIRSIN